MTADNQRDSELRSRLHRLIEIGVALSLEHDLRALLDRILAEARRFTHADAGTLYLVNGDGLTFEVAHNDSLYTNAGEGMKTEDIPPVPINANSASGYSAMTGEVLNIADVYDNQQHQFATPKTYDQMTGYRTKSMLVVPMENHEKRVIGVLQLINALAPNSGEVVSFSSDDEELTVSLASQASVAVNNVRLIEETKRLHHQNQMILNTAGEGIFGLDADGHLTFTNPAAADMLDWPAKELVSRSHCKFCHAPDGVARQEGGCGCPIMASCQQGVEQRRSDEVFWKRDGTSFLVDYVATPIRETDSPGGAVVVFRDVTEERRAQDERRSLERGLIQSERMASVGIVTAGIVHNLRNPLSVVLGHSELMQSEHPEVTDVGQIFSAAQQMAQMIEDVLAKSRQKQAREAVNVNDLMQRELDFLRADRTFKYQVEQDIRLAPDVPAIECVYSDLSQVVGNLLRNAVEAMRDREPKKLSVVTSTETGFVVIGVTDTGCGIAESDLPKLFQPFFTARKSSGDGEEGTGLGLYTVQQLIEPYDAEIEVDSEVDVGTTFRVKIPAEVIGPDIGEVLDSLTADS